MTQMLTSAHKYQRLCDLGQELGIRPCWCVTRGSGGSPNRPPRQANHAAFFSLFMGSSRKNGRLGDPALPSLSSNSFHVKHFHPQFLESPSGGSWRLSDRLLPAGDFCKAKPGGSL